MGHENEQNTTRYTLVPDWEEEGEGFIARPIGAPDNMEAIEKEIEAVQSS